MNKKVIVFVVTILILSFSLASVGFAAGQFKNLKAWFGEIKIFRNQTQIQLEPKPFIVDGTTYVPLRALSNIFDKEILWDGTNYRIDINDKPGQISTDNFNYMMGLLTEKQNEINELKAKVAKLEKELAAKESSKTSISELEKYLNKEYGYYRNMWFDIYLSGKKDDIIVKIYVDLDKYYSKWNALSSTQIKSFIEDIVEEIEYDYNNADIEGYIEDDSTGDKLVDFYINAKGNLIIDTDYDYYSGSNTLSDMEKYLNNYHDECEGVEFVIKLYWDKYDIEVNIDADDWFKLSSYERKDYLEEIYYQINRKFPDAEIYGDVYDEWTKDIIYFDFDSRGKVIIDY